MNHSLLVKPPLINKTRGVMIARKVRYCANIFDRMKGLLGTKIIADDEACWIIPCYSIHTFAMNYPIDAYFLNRKNEVVFLLKNLEPNRLSPVVWNAHSVVEFKAGPERNIHIGDKLSWEETSIWKGA